MTNDKINKNNSISPMMAHYLEVKEKHKDCVLFYRLGDFYEMFFDDAIRVSAMLDLTLTGRDCGLSERAPMCGIPYHAADIYISKLVSMGEKVAICEQLTEPKKGVKLVERDVIKIITAGTLTNDELIDEKSNNFLTSVYINGDSSSVSWADITTGEFFVKTFVSKDFISKTVELLSRISPAEIISDRKTEETLKDIPLFTYNVLPKINVYSDGEYQIDNAENSLKTQFGVLNLDAYGFINQTAVSAAGALISYLKETQKRSLINFTDVKVEKDGEFMELDINAVKNLELVKTIKDDKRYGSLLWLLDRTKTNMGARKLQSYVLTPLGDVDKINYRLNSVNALYQNNLIRQAISDILSSVRDVGRITGKISNGNLTPKDCLALCASLENIPTIKFQLSGIEEDFIKDIVYDLKEFTDLVKLLKSAISEDASAIVKDGNYIKEGFSEELDRLRAFNKNGLNMIAKMENAEKEATGIKNLKIRYNRIFGYYIEITNSFKDLVPLHYVRRQTVAGAERYITEELKQLESDILTSAEKSLALESKIFNDVKAELEKNTEDLLSTSEALSNLDVLISFATVAKENGYVMPKIAKKGEPLFIKEGRHPVVEKILKQKFVPNDVLLDGGENRTMILTGPNMAGKSTYMRQVALITIMAHIGSFVPAEEAIVPLTDKIFTRIGASDNLISNQSTFMVEMTEVANIIKNATKDSLLILDEIGRGTSTYDGLSIAWAVAEYINDNIKAKTMFATHYHELTDLEGKMEGVKNYKVAVKELANGIVFIRKIMRGGTNRSFGIEVAELAGVDKKLTDRAKQILKSLEKGNGRGAAEEEKPAAAQKSEAERIIEEIDINNLSPMQAFNVLSDLCEKVKR